MIDMMRSVVDGGTGGRLRFRYGLKGAIAGKTGTTNDNSDGWFIGYTPAITAGVWVGGEDRYVHFNSTNLGQGANMALPIWGLWMKKCVADGTLGISEAEGFEIPPGVSIGCSGSSDAPTETEKMEDTSAYQQKIVLSVLRLAVLLFSISSSCFRIASSRLCSSSMERCERGLVFDFFNLSAINSSRFTILANHPPLFKPAEDRSAHCSADDNTHPRISVFHP